MPNKRSIAQHRRHKTPTAGRLKRHEREQQLLDAALTLFGERGYQGTSIEDIARAAGVTRPIIYSHFGSKDGAYLACLRRARNDLEARMIEAADPEGSLADQLAGCVSAYFALVDRGSPAWQLLYGGGAAVAGPAAAEAARLRFATVDRIAKLIRGAAPGIDRRSAAAFAHAVSGAGEQLAKWWQQNPKLRRDQVSAYLIAFAWHGFSQLAAVGGHSRPSSRRARRSGMEARAGRRAG